jgi:hypothetical protein
MVDEVIILIITSKNIDVLRHSRFGGYNCCGLPVSWCELLIFAYFGPSFCLEIEFIEVFAGGPGSVVVATKDI